MQTCKYCGREFDPVTLLHDDEAQDDHWPVSDDGS